MSKKPVLNDNANFVDPQTEMFSALLMQMKMLTAQIEQVQLIMPINKRRLCKVLNRDRYQEGFIDGAGI